MEIQYFEPREYFLVSDHLQKNQKLFKKYNNN